MDLIHKIGYIFDRKQKIRLIQLGMIIVIGALFELLGVSAILPFINVVMDPDSIKTTPYLDFFYGLFNFDSANDFIIILGIFLIIVYIVKNLYIALMYDVQYRFTYRNQCRISSKLLRSYLKESYLFHVEHNSSELLRNVNVDVSIFFQVVLAILQLFTEISVCFVLVIFLLFMDVWITIGVSILLGIFATGFMGSFRTKLKEMGLRSRNYQTEMNKWMLQAMGGIKEIKVMNSEVFFGKQYEKFYYLYAESQRKYSLLGILPRPILEMFCVTGLLCVVTIRLLYGVELDNIIPILSVFAIAAFRMLPSFNRITSNMNIVMFNRTAVDKIYSDLKQTEEYIEKKNLEEGIKLDFCQDINVKDLTFTYPGSDKIILEKINLKIPKNSSVAFIGSSGAGKTTLVDLILGLLDPQDG